MKNFGTEGFSRWSQVTFANGDAWHGRIKASPRFSVTTPCESGTANNIYHKHALNSLLHCVPTSINCSWYNPRAVSSNQKTSTIVTWFLDCAPQSRNLQNACIFSGFRVRVLRYSGKFRDHPKTCSRFLSYMTHTIQIQPQLTCKLTLWTPNQVFNQ